MFVTRGKFLNGVDVRAALVRERRRADPRQARVVPHVRDFIHEPGKFLELRQRFHRHGSFFQLQRDARDHARQIAIARALAVTVDRALHMNRAGFERGQRVRDAEADVVVRVDADFAIQFAQRSFRDRRDFVWQTAAVRVA